MVIQIGDRVVHNGTEKTVNDIAGDVLILSDGMAVSSGDVSLSRKVEAAPEISKDQLRRDIEALNAGSTIDLVREVVGMVDPTMTIPFNQPWDEFKKALTHRALYLRKIDPRSCPTCGQRIAE